MLCGASPIQASSGKTSRHRLNRGGDRQANAALYRIVLVRLCYDQQTKNYMARRLTQGKTKEEGVTDADERARWTALVVAALAGFWWAPQGPRVRPGSRAGP